MGLGKKAGAGIETGENAMGGGVQTGQTAGTMTYGRSHGLYELPSIVGLILPPRQLQSDSIASD